MFPRRYVAGVPFDQPIPPIPPLAREGMLLRHEMRDGRLIMENPLGPVARRFLTGFRHTIRALAPTGNSVIVDDVLQEPEQRAECVAILAGLPLLFVGVRCPVAVAAQRERERGDRLIGLAAWQAERVHRGALYDIEVDNVAAQTGRMCGADSCSPRRDTNTHRIRADAPSGSTGARLRAPVRGHPARKAAPRRRAASVSSASG